jgi:hypothetical protein
MASKVLVTDLRVDPTGKYKSRTLVRPKAKVKDYSQINPEGSSHRSKLSNLASVVNIGNEVSCSKKVQHDGRIFGTCYLVGDRLVPTYHPRRYNRTT